MLRSFPCEPPFQTLFQETNRQADPIEWKPSQRFYPYPAIMAVDPKRHQGVHNRSGAGQFVRRIGVGQSDDLHTGSAS